LGALKYKERFKCKKRHYAIKSIAMKSIAMKSIAMKLTHCCVTKSVAKLPSKKYVAALHQKMKKKSPN